MPVHQIENDDGDKVDRYYVVLWPEPFAEADAILRGMRRGAQQERDAALVDKKAMEKAGNIDAARHFREEASSALKRYRAICMVGSRYMTAPLPGDCLIGGEPWPAELASELDAVIGALTLRNYPPESNGIPLSRRSAFLLFAPVKWVLSGVNA